MKKIRAKAFWTLVAAIFSASACSSTAAAEPLFVLCNRDYPWRVTVDYETRSGNLVDYVMRVQRCDHDGPSCMSFPFPFSSPPRLPATGEASVSWRVGEIAFDMKPMPGRPDLYEIFAILADGLQYRYEYDLSAGILSMQVGRGPGDAWDRCQGEMTFAHLWGLVF